jgi:threonyl-tRNA synthetase
LRNEKIGFKIRQQYLQKVPYQVILGTQEQHTQTATVRLSDGSQLKGLSLNELREKIENTAVPPLALGKERGKD